MRPIDADALKHELLTNLNFMLYDGTRMDTGDLLMRRGDVMGLIIDQPTLDYAPVVHGEWEKEQNGFIPADICCSECGKKYNFFAPPNFCPNCGANMMDGGWKHDET